LTDIASNIETLRSSIPSAVKIIAVSKTKPAGDILVAYQAGQRAFGENRVPELAAKHEALPADIEWHMIGHLQTNKVKQLIPLVSLIHSIDSFRLLSTVDIESQRLGLITDCLLQFHIAKEESKSGFSIDEALLMLDSVSFTALKNVRICGVMGMATYTDNIPAVRNEFSELRSIFTRLKEAYFRSDESFREISMGMSGDYPIAIGEGATMVRIGSLIFGER
jgi:PLP dependent protein